MQPIAKKGPIGNTLASPKGEVNVSSAAKPTKHNHGMMDIELSSEGLDDSGMKVPPLLNTQHDVGVDADMSSKGQANICMDISPLPQAQHSYGLDKSPSPQSQHSYERDSAPLPEGIDFGMDRLPPPGAPCYEIADAPQLVEPEDCFNKPLRAEEDVIKDIPQPKDVHGESLAVCMFTEGIIPLTLLV